MAEGGGGAVGGEVGETCVELARVGSEPGLQPVGEIVVVWIVAEILVGRVEAEAADPVVEGGGGPGERVARVVV